MQNYREESYPRQDASASWSAFHQAFVAVVAAVLVGLLLSTFAIAGARLVPAESDCVMTDNAGCVSAPALGGGESGVAADTRRGDKS